MIMLLLLVKRAFIIVHVPLQFLSPFEPVSMYIQHRIAQRPAKHLLIVTLATWL